MCILFLLINSCKKEIYDAEKADPARKKVMLAYKNGPKVDIIPFAQFKLKANLNALGILKQQFVAVAPLKSKTMSINTTETYLGFNIITDSIKVIKDKGHTMYVFPVVLPSKRAVSFQNLTIDESAERTLVFVNTYTPNKKWIEDLKKGHPGKFEGEISVTYLDLGNGTAQSSTHTSVKATRNETSSAQNSAIVNNAPVCTTTTYYYQVPYPCASGNHYPGQNCYLEGVDRAGYNYFSDDVTICVGNPGGGGGGTTPTPPGDYDPCPEDPTPPGVSNKKASGNKIMIIPPTDCDEDIPLPEEPPAVIDTIINVKNTCLKTLIQNILNSNIKSDFHSLVQNYLINDPEITITIEDYTDTLSQNVGEMSPLALVPISGKNYLTGRLRLNLHWLKGASDEFKTITVYHELLHAYLGRLGGLYNGPSINHSVMATSYKNMLSSALQATGTNSTDADALAWAGLQGTAMWQFRPVSTQEYYTNIELSYMKGGAKGTKCDP